MSEELKPCPFCGGTDLHEIEGQVMCENQCINGDPDEGSLPSLKTWNARPIEDALKAALVLMTADRDSENHWAETYFKQAAQLESEKDTLSLVYVQVVEERAKLQEDVKRFRAALTFVAATPANYTTAYEKELRRIAREALGIKK